MTTRYEVMNLNVKCAQPVVFSGLVKQEFSTPDTPSDPTVNMADM